MMTTESRPSADLPKPPKPPQKTAQPKALIITDPMLRSLSQTKPWALFLSILGFISVGFMIIMGGFNMVGFSNINTENTFIPFFLIGIFNILMGLLYLFPSLYLFKFSSSIGRLLDGGGSREMEEALSSQKSFWKFVGILTLISFGFAILGIAAAIIIPQFANVVGQ